MIPLARSSSERREISESPSAGMVMDWEVTRLCPHFDKSGELYSESPK